jgi:hypothetical protein
MIHRILAITPLYNSDSHWAGPPAWCLGTLPEKEINMLQRRARALFLIAVVGCAGERQTEQSQEIPRPLDPGLAKLLINSGVQGPVAVFERLDDANHSQVAFTAGKRYAVGAARAPGSTASFDVQASDALFIVNPRGPRMLHADSSVTVAWSVFCLRQTSQGTEIIRSLSATIHQISNRVIDGTGGHLHTNGTKPVGGWTPSSGQLDANAQFVTKYISQIASGDERLTLRYTPRDTPCAGILDSVLYLTATRVQGLVNLSGHTHMYFDPSSHPAHDSIFFIKPSVESHVHRAADEYYLQSPQATGAQDSLKITSISLKYGGLYDIDSNWAIPHETHKLGTDVDVNGRNPNSPQLHEVLRRITEAVTPARKCEAHPLNASVKTHLHCYFGPPYGPKGQ